MEGIKYDDEKPDYSLVPPFALNAMVEVLTIGAKKYSRDNWKKLDDGQNRYFAAAQRHLWAYHNGELTDPETGKCHLAHAACCIYFMLENEKSNLQNNENELK